MTRDSFKPKAYLLEGCPFSFKFLLFMTEAGLGEQVEMIRCDPDSDEFEAIWRKLEAGLGRHPTFPTVEVKPGRYQADSDQLIQLYATGHGVDPSSLPTLSFYLETIYPQLLELHSSAG